jgi:hypothetical protein
MIAAFKRWRRARHRKMLRFLAVQHKAAWAARTDDEIINAYKDSMSWLMLEKPGKHTSGYTLPISFSNSCRGRLEKYILPEMKKRGIDEKQFTDRDLTEYIFNA